MEQIPQVDLHMHSDFSDGTDSPEALLRKVIKAGIRIFSLTDHDTYEGGLLIQKALRKKEYADVEFYMGIEFSCISPEGKLHLLGYGFDPEHALFQAAYEEGRALRRQKLEYRLRYLREKHGILFSREDIDMLRGLPSCGKPHLAKLLMRYGYGDSISDAIKTYIKGAPMPEQPDRISAATAIRAIAEAGGVSSWAHPLRKDAPKEEKEQFERQLAYLCGEGLDAMECYHSRYSKETEKFLKKQAKKAGLLRSGGSDYHGKNKQVPLGELCSDGHCVKNRKITILERLKQQ